MFGFIADILTSITSVLFPVFFSYKALRTSDPAVLTPWLMYWATLSLCLFAESWLYFILYWVPFYSWMRFGMALYLVLPGQQGSVFIYQAYIEPFFERYERTFDRMISEGHAKAKAAGGDAIKRGIEYAKVQFLGMPPSAPSPQPSRNVSYSTYLMDRFAMPAARGGLATAGTSDIFGLIGKALQQTTYPDAKSQDAQARDLSQSGTLIPPTLSGEERTDFIATQRERLETLLKAFDNEASYLNTDAYASHSSGAHPRSGTPRQPSSRKSYLAPSESTYLHTSRSESEFEDLGYETMGSYMPDPDAYRMPETDQYRSSSHGYAAPPQYDRRSPRSSSGPGPGSAPGPGDPPPQGASWSSWIWGSYGEQDSVIDPRKDR